MMNRIRRFLAKRDSTGHPVSTRVGPQVIRVTDLPVGTTAPIASIAPESPVRIERLALFGITVGTSITLTARWPSCVISFGGTSIALDDEIGNDIYVSRSN